MEPLLMLFIFLRLLWAMRFMVKHQVISHGRPSFWKPWEFRVQMIQFCSVGSSYDAIYWDPCLPPVLEAILYLPFWTFYMVQCCNVAPCTVVQYYSDQLIIQVLVLFHDIWSMSKIKPAFIYSHLMSNMFETASFNWSEIGSTVYGFPEWWCSNIICLCGSTIW